MAQVETKDWPATLERLLAGDRRAYLELARLITGFLVRLRAYDFRDEWDDLRQEVLASLVANARAGRLRDAQAFVGYAKVVTRNKFVDRLKKELRHGGSQTLAWDEETARAAVAWPESEATRSLWAAVAELPEESRRIVEGVYREGRTYEEMSDVTGIPLGTLKRRLGESLAFLRRRLAEGAGDA